MNVSDAQQEMRHAYLGGSAGLLASASVWLVSGLVAAAASPRAAVLALLVGGMLIHPVAVGLAKALGRPGTHDRENPLGTLALEGIVWFLLTIPLAYVISLERVEWFFPAMLLLVGGRYLTFRTLYGMRLYWLCGATLAVASVGLVVFEAPPAVGAFTGAVLEYGFAGAVVWAARGMRPERAA